jgi:hypothetical protein
LLSKLPSSLFQKVELDVGQLVLGHVFECSGVEHIVWIPGLQPQQAQEVHSALAFRALEPSEEVLADTGAVPPLAGQAPVSSVWR